MNYRKLLYSSYVDYVNNSQTSREVKYYEYVLRILGEPLLKHLFPLEGKTGTGLGRNDIEGQEAVDKYLDTYLVRKMNMHGLSFRQQNLLETNNIYMTDSKGTRFTQNVKVKLESLLQTRIEALSYLLDGLNTIPIKDKQAQYDFFMQKFGNGSYGNLYKLFGTELRGKMDGDYKSQPLWHLKKIYIEMIGSLLFDNLILHDTLQNVLYSDACSSSGGTIAIDALEMAGVAASQVLCNFQFSRKSKVRKSKSRKRKFRKSKRKSRKSKRKFRKSKRKSRKSKRKSRKSKRKFRKSKRKSRKSKRKSRKSKRKSRKSKRKSRKSKRKSRKRKSRKSKRKSRKRKSRKSKRKSRKRKSRKSKRKSRKRKSRKSKRKSRKSKRKFRKRKSK
jgi:hypothetical protein